MKARAAAVAAVLALPAAGAGALAAGMPPLQGCAAATWSHHAALVVEHGDGRVINLCIGFDAASITGEDMLRASGLEFGTVSFGSLGDAVCQIDNEPASYPPSCFTTTSPYWVLFASRHGGAWTAADHGVSSEAFADGDAAGFRYDPQSGSAAPPASPAGVCALAAPRSTLAPTARPAARPATAAPAPAATYSPLPATAAPETAAATPGVSGSPPPRAHAAGAGGGLLGLLGLLIARRRR